MNIFVAYDFRISGTLPDVIDAVSERPPSDFVVHWPGAPDGRTQGAIWGDVVKPGIHSCDRLVAYSDSPNANVGFEVGYALGLGKSVALARVKRSLPSWLELPPLIGHLCEFANTPDLLRQLVSRSQSDWVSFQSLPKPGDETLFLCPLTCGAAYSDLAESHWRRPPDRSWGLENLPELLEGIQTVVWVIAPHDDGIQARDGDENAALSVIAGYAESLPDTELHVWIHEQARSVADVVSRKEEFASRRDLRRLCDAISPAKEKANAKAKVAIEREPHIDNPGAYDIEQLRIAYENTAKTRYPCPGVSLDDLDWELVNEYAANLEDVQVNSKDRSELLSILGFYSPLCSNEQQLHRAAVLCFCKHPEKFIPQARANFIVGDSANPELIRDDVTGPLSRQIERLTTLVLQNLDPISRFDNDVARRDERELPVELVREVISNGIAHRDYESHGLVQVQLTEDFVEVRSPGKFIPGTSWRSFMKGQSGSHPIDPAVTIYLTTLRLFEGMGRGFQVFRKHAAAFGSKSIKGIERSNPDSILVQIRRRKKSPTTRQSKSRSFWSFLVPSWWQSKKLTLCPFCLTEVRYEPESYVCNNCGKETSAAYVDACSESKPIISPVIGFTAHGKTVFLSAAIATLRRLPELLPRAATLALTNDTLLFQKDAFQTLDAGRLPHATDLGDASPIAIELVGLSPHQRRILVLQDAAGEKFNDFQFRGNGIKFLTSGIPMLVISLQDLFESNESSSMDDLLMSYHRTRQASEANPNRAPYSAIVVFTKADCLQDSLPSALWQYLQSDPFAAEANSSAVDVNEYIEKMNRVHLAIAEWLKDIPGGSRFLNLAENLNIQMRFSIVSSLGLRGEVSRTWQPSRVIDPLLWLLQMG